MKLLNFNIIKLTICLIIGICIGFYFEFSLSILLSIFGVLLAGLLTLHFTRKTKASHTFGIFAFLIFVCIGIIRTKLYDDTLLKSHYINSNIEIKDYQDFTFRITKRLKPDNYNDKFIAEILTLNGIKSSGKILINIEKDSTSEPLKIDDILFTNNTLTEVVKPKNPFQFDYNAYLKQRNIHHQLYLNQNEVIPLKSETKTIFGYADDFRRTVNSKLQKENFSPETLSIINALLLGQRQDISTETYNNYVNAGTIHILAVSGLHVGILFMILTFILKPLHYLRYGKRYYKPLLIVAILWAFAFVAGLSPSVTRAVTMFSIVALSDLLLRPKNIFNTLVISAFILLLFKPIYLFDVGFQMSYLAVLAIVTIQPFLYKLWKPRFKVIDYFWQIFTVTLAAQLGVAPIGLFYFHQFPGLFFVSNLVIIPFLGIILGVGILVILLSLLDILPPFLSKTFNIIIEGLNAFIAWIAKFEDFLFRDISFSIFHVTGSYLIIISTFYFFKKRSYQSIQYALLSILLFSCFSIYSKHKTSYDELVIFNKNRTSLIAKKTNKQLKIFTNNDSLKSEESNTIKNYVVGSFIKNTTKDSLNTVYRFKNELILVIDNLGVYNSKSFKPDYILLKDSPKVNLNRLIDSINPKLIIADASNYKSYVLRWKETCEHKKIPFHSTYEKGAYILKPD